MSGSEIAKYGDIAVPDGQILAQLNYPWSVGREIHSLIQINLYGEAYWTMKASNKLLIHRLENL